MYFLSVLIIAFLLHYQRHIVRRIQNDKAFNTLYTLSNSHSVQFIISIALPSLLLFFLFYLLHGKAWGIPSLIFSCIGLMYALGHGRFISLINQYKKVWATHDYAAFPVIFAELDKYQKTQSDDSLCQLHATLRTLFIYHAFSRLFVVLFWFVLCGPAIAIFYRLNKLAIINNQNTIALWFEKVMEWPAAQLFAISTAFLGDFKPSFDYYQSAWHDNHISHKELIQVTSCLSLNLDPQWQSSRFTVEHNEQEIAQKAMQEIDIILAFMRRALVFAIVIIAIGYIIF